jgi:hypothetical protein
VRYWMGRAAAGSMEPLLLRAPLKEGMDVLDAFDMFEFVRRSSGRLPLASMSASVH